jgi:para-nitrobenzyl esterase
LRFRAPQAAAKWEGIRDATHNASSCVQPDSPLTNLNGTERSEDCLYLNVWAPREAGNHPVFVWVHGGSNTVGSPSETIYDGTEFARRGVVVVDIAYRVGILGFLELDKILGPDYRGSASNGLKDITAALGWVRDNIHAVGNGDPTRVTLAGESAGGKNVTSLLGAPSARGLFQSVIIESGGQAIFSQEAARNIARIVAKTIEETGGAAKNLLTLPPERILALQDELEKRIDRRSPYRAVVGDDFLPEAPLAAIGKGAMKNVRLLIGTNRDEMAIFTQPEAAGTPLAQSEMANLDLASAEPIYRHYAAAYPTLPPLALRIRFLTAEEYWVPNMRIAQAHRQASAAGTTWVYRFDREASSGMFAGQVPHASELPYVWNNLDDPLYAQVLGPKDAVDRKIADEMHGRWISFIFGKTPDVPGSPSWPTFGRQDQILIFGDVTKAGKLDEAELALWPE